MKPLALGLIIDRSIKELIKSGSDSPSLDIYLMSEKVLNKNRTFILSHTDFPVSNLDYSKFRKYLNRRKKGEPIAYILGHKEFYGYDFSVNKNVLIPRPETEWLVEESVKSIKAKVHKGDPFSIIDVGTGSSCIVISLAKQFNNLTTCLAGRRVQQLNLYASDISKKALYLAKKNAKIHGVNKDIKFYHSNLFKSKRMPKKYDLIIANLPYVPTKGESQKAKGKRFRGVDFEPQEAIFAKDYGASIIKKFLNESKERLNKDGNVLIELDPRNANDINNYTKKLFINYNIELKKDLAGLNRYLIIS